VAEGLQDRVTGDLGEGDALGLARIEPQQIGHVVGDRLAFAVVVGRQDELVRLLEGLLQRRNVLLGVLGDLVGDAEAPIDVHAEVALGQVADVAVGGTD
jgi:hypothetical protein